MIRIGIAGIGFMGMTHYSAAKKVSGGAVTAIATRNPKKRAGDWTMIQGNFGPRGGNEDLSGVKTFESADEMIADPDIDLVDVCLPNDRHTDTAIRALEAGKHVLVEKAIALSIEAADRMVATAEKTGKRLMVAHVLPFFPEFAFALEAIRGGEYGSVKAAHFRRHISRPDWSAAMTDADKTGGPVVDLHIHDTHFISLAFGTPKRVSSRGLLKENAAEYVVTQYLYDAPEPVVSATSGSLSQASRPFTHGFEIYFDKATLMYEAGSPLTLYGPDGVVEPELGSADPVDAFTTELQHAVDVVAGKRSPGVLDAAPARDALALVLKEEESVRRGTPIEVA